MHPRFRFQGLEDSDRIPPEVLMDIGTLEAFRDASLGRESQKGRSWMSDAGTHSFGIAKELTI
jgi:hypothetical protein